MSIKLSSYFERIGYRGAQEPGLEVLTQLHDLHTKTIPFENINPFIGAEIALDSTSLSQKLIQGQRGGYCFEQNAIFLDVLLQLGFKAHGLGARVLMNQPEGMITRRSHMLVAVDLDEGTYIADVGFGGLTLTSPMRLELDTEQSTTHEPFRLVALEGNYVLQAKINHEWKSLYRFDLQQQFPADYEVINYYLSTHPLSPFRVALIAARPTDEGRYALRNHQLSFYPKTGEIEKRDLTSVEEIKDVLQKKFGIRLPEGNKLDERIQEILPLGSEP